QHQQVRFVDCLQNLALDLEVHRDPWIVGQSAGVDEPELTPIPVGARKMPITRRSSLLTDDGAVLADDAIEQRGLANVGPADERDHGKIHTATAVGSASSTSMKS